MSSQPPADPWVRARLESRLFAGMLALVVMIGLSARAESELSSDPGGDKVAPGLRQQIPGPDQTNEPALPGFPPEAPLSLTDSEKAWLADHKTIRVGFDAYYPPYSFLNENGDFEGLAVDVIQLLAHRIGVTIEVSPTALWKDLVDAARRHEVDVVATMGRQPDREQWFLFTRPYIFKSLVIMTRKETTGIHRPEDLAGKQVAVVKGYQYVQPFLKQYPTIQPCYVDTMLDGLNAVSVGQADAAITYVGAGHYLKTRHQLANLKFAAVIERDRFTESMAVRKDWPELAAILDKALASISAEEMAELNRRWSGPEPIIGIDRRTVFLYLASGLGIVLLVAMAAMAWGRALKRAVHRRTAELRQELVAREKAEAALRVNEERMRLFFDRQITGMAITSPEKGWLQVNDALCQMLGYTREELIRLTWAELTHPDDHALDATQFNRLLAGEIEAYAFDKRFLRKDGSVVHTSLSIGCVRRSDGAVDYVLATLVDITDRKQTEEVVRQLHAELLQHAAELEGRVADRTRELQDTQAALLNMVEDLNEMEIAKERAEAADQVKSMFLATMSHELRTPLNSILGFTGILLQELPGPLNPEQIKQLKMVQGSARHLLSLINDVLDISKIEAGELTVSPDRFDLRATIERAIATIRPLAETKRLALRLEVSPAIGELVSDVRRVEQILLNLLNNAVKFTETGTVSLTADVVGARIWLQITDTGIGIKPEDLDTLFQPFQQVENGMARRHEGTGLGLVICRRLAGLLGGEIQVASEPGCGSTFTVLLPAHPHPTP